MQFESSCGTFAGLRLPLHNLDEGERAVLRQLSADTYETFVSKMSHYRKIERGVVL